MLVVRMMVLWMLVLRIIVLRMMVVRGHGSQVFACGRVHRSAINILQQKFDGDYDTFSKIQHINLREMFNSFRRQWRWDLRDDEHIFHGFVNVLKGRYPDIMSEFREFSKGKARENGHVIPQGEARLDITCNYPPDNMPLDRWQRLCKIWNTEKWLKRSKTGRNNRKNDLSRHTRGSMGFDEHRIRLDKQKRKMVGYELVFIDTHATKETKKRLREGEININDLDELEFVTSRSKESFVKFHNELVKEYGPNNDQNFDRDELAMWERLHPNNRGQMFGIGSSDPRFVVTGSQSSCGSISYGDARQSQEVKDVRSQLEKEKEARQDLETRLKQMERQAENERIEREKERIEREKLQKQMEEIIKKIADK
ncbi:hypothetical protein R6Q57_008087 [Mikania cordata]